MRVVASWNPAPRRRNRSTWITAGSPSTIAQRLMHDNPFGAESVLTRSERSVFASRHPRSSWLRVRPSRHGTSGRHTEMRHGSASIHKTKPHPVRLMGILGALFAHLPSTPLLLHLSVLALPWPLRKALSAATRTCSVTSMVTSRWLPTPQRRPSTQQAVRKQRLLSWFAASAASLLAVPHGAARFFILSPPLINDMPEKLVRLMCWQDRSPSHGPQTALLRISGATNTHRERFN